MIEFGSMDFLVDGRQDRVGAFHAGDDHLAFVAFCEDCVRRQRLCLISHWLQVCEYACVAFLHCIEEAAARNHVVPETGRFSASCPAILDVTVCANSGSRRLRECLASR